MVIDLPAFPSSGPAAPPPNLARVAALVAVAAVERRAQVGKALAAVGIRTIAEAPSLAEARANCAAGGFPLLVLEQEIGGEDATPLLRDLRQGLLGPDPFVLAVMLLAARDETRVRAAIDSGPDDLLLVPFSVGQLVSRLTALVERRKPFVVTHDYLGPDRRAAPRPGPGRGGISVPQIVVPHPLRARAAGWTAEQYEQARAEAVRTLGRERIRRLALAIEWESVALLEAGGDDAAAPDRIGATLARLDTLARQLATWGEGVPDHPTTGIDALRAELTRLAAAPEAIGRPELEALTATARHLAATHASASR